MIDKSYAIAMALVTVLLCVGVTWIVMDYFGRKWYGEWMNTIMTFQEDEEDMLRQVKIEFIHELAELHHKTEETKKALRSKIKNKE